MTVGYATPIRTLVEEALVSLELDEFVKPGGGASAVLDDLYYTDYAASLDADGLSFVIDLLIPVEIAISLPGVDSLALVIGGGAGATRFRAALFVGPRDFELRLDDIDVALRFPPSVLKPVPPATGGPAPAFAQIQTTASIVLDRNFNIRVEGDQSLTLQECEIAGSGVTMSATGVSWNFERGKTLPAATTAGLQGEFIGVAFTQAKLKLPPDIAGAPEISFDYCCIGTGGFTGGVALAFGTPPACEIGGFEVELERVGIRFQQSRLVAGEIEALLKGENGDPLPFFDTYLAVDLQLRTEGGLRIAIAPAPDRLPAGTQVSNGLVTVRKPGIVSMTLESLELVVAQGKGALKLGGSIKPEVGLPGGEPLPAFGVKALTITTDGEVSVDGGWIDMPRATRLALGPFGLEITRAGIGSEPSGERWVGFSGALSLASGVPMSAAVDGLKIRWDETGLKGVDLAGIALELEVEGVLKFAGEVRFLSNPERFEGAGTLELTSLGLTVSARVVIGKRADYTFLYFYLLVAPPVGVPIFSTGLAFYSLEALYARNMEPNKTPAERWFQDWYRRPELGAVDQQKWSDVRGSQAFGAGVTVGTLPDKGYSVAVKGLLVVVVPGPVLLLDARANILRDPAALAAPAAQALFNALVVYDGRQGTVELAIEPHYVFPDAGELVDVSGIAEAFYSFNDPRAWHVYLGRREREQRIRARLLSLFEANAYLMLDPDSIELGGFIGYDATYTAGPARLTLQAFIEGFALVSFRPKQFKGQLHLQGGIALSVCGIGFGISASATLAAQAPQPFEIDGKLYVKVDLPWPLPDLEASVGLHWETPGPPRLTVPLQAAGIQHPITLTSWQLGGSAPVVPLDGRLGLVFDRPVEDRARVGANAQPAPARPLGDYSIAASLAEIELQEFDGSWKPFATTSGGGPGQPRRLYGMWQSEPGDSGQGNRRLQLWVRSPYEWKRPLSEPSITQLEEAERFSPCEPMLETRLVEFDERDNEVIPPFTAMQYADISWTAGRRGAAVVEVATATRGDTISGTLPKPYYRCLFLPDQLGLVVVTGAGATSVSPAGSAPPGTPALRLDFPSDVKGIVVLALASGSWSLEAFDAAGASLGTAQASLPLTVGRASVSQLVLRARGIRRVHIDTGGLRTALLALAVEGAPSATEQAAARTAIEQSLERFRGEEPILDPNKRYRLRVKTVLRETANRSLAGAEIEQSPIAAAVSLNGAECTLEQSFEFRTEGPPGATSITVDRLDTLEPYVRETVPVRAAPAVYRAFDLGAAFNSDYVDQMYRASGRSLVLRLQSDDGELVIVSNTMGKGNEIVLRREERTWLTTLARSTCQLTVDEAQIVRESAVKAQLPQTPLTPRKRYDVALVAEETGGANPTPPLYQWSFVTSGYRNFAEHITLSNPVRAATISATSLTQWRTAAAPAIAVGDPWEASADDRERSRTVESAVFRDLFDRLDVERVLPADVELHRLQSGAATWGMLLSSPEPFDWERIGLALLGPQLSIRRRSLLDSLRRLVTFTPRAPLPVALLIGPISVRALRDRDGTRAILLRLEAGEVAEFTAGGYWLTATYRRDLGPGRPVLTERGSSADEQGTIAWSVP